MSCIQKKQLTLSNEKSAMNSTIESISVSGFWGSHEVSLDFDEGVNFLIGPNGSGKTTLINMLAATLSADFVALDQFDFESIEIKLKRQSPYSKPIIRVVKNEHPKFGVEELTYYISEKSSTEAEAFPLSDFLPLRYRRDPRYWSKFKGRASPRVTPIEERIKELCDISWLSVHRSPIQNEDGGAQESAIDKKLTAIAASLAQFFSGLQKESAEEVEKFQEKIFLSLLSKQSDTALINRVRELDFDEEATSLAEAFRELGVDERRFGPRLKKHFSSVQQALKKISSQTPLDFSDLHAIVNARGMHYVVSEWHKLAEKKEEIFLPKVTFLNLVNRFFQRKELKVDSGNRIYASTQSGKSLEPTLLSSGEKQLLILLSEALLQREKTFIYVADEPELSLHVEWQSQLVSSLKKINKNSQIIFATHSPDIVGPFSEKIINMERVIE